MKVSAEDLLLIKNLTDQIHLVGTATGLGIGFLNEYASLTNYFMNEEGLVEDDIEERIRDELDDHLIGENLGRPAKKFLKDLMYHALFPTLPFPSHLGPN